MKDKKLFAMILFFIILVLGISIIFYYNYDLNRINKRVKNENYQLRLENKKLKRIQLEYIIGDNNDK